MQSKRMALTDPRCTTIPVANPQGKVDSLLQLDRNETEEVDAKGDLEPRQRCEL
jgi:hypothetical protein